LQSWQGVAPLKRWVPEKVLLVAVIGRTYVMVMMIMMVIVMMIPCKRMSDLLYLYFIANYQLRRVKQYYP